MTEFECDLWLIRHPEPDASARGLCYGSLDVDLSPAGRRQAGDVAAALTTVSFAAIYTSPRTRCRYAAKILAAGRNCPVEIVDGLRELHFGEFEGRAYGDIAQQYPEMYARWMERPTEIDIPGGETFPAMWARVTETCRELRSRQSGTSIACVTHGGVIRIILAEALGMPASEIFSIAQRYGGISRVKYYGRKAIVEFMNAAAP